GGLRGHPGGEPVGRRLHVGVDGGAEQGPVAGGLGAVVPGDELGQDAEQPRPRVGIGQVVAAAPGEGDQERLADQVLGGLRAEAARDVPVEHAGVAVEELGERLGFGQRGADELRVRGPGGGLCDHLRPSAGGSVEDVSPQPAIRVHGGYSSLRKPPSTARSAPVVLAERGEASSATASATSCGRTSLPVTRRIISAATEVTTVAASAPAIALMTSAAPPSFVHQSVSTGPGEMVFTLMPRDPYSSETALLTWFSAALAAP